MSETGPSRAVVVRVSHPADDAALAAIDAATWTTEVSPAPAPPPGATFFDERTVAASVLVDDVLMARHLA